MTLNKIMFQKKKLQVTKIGIFLVCFVVAFSFATTVSAVAPQCSDGIDNDGDGYTDFSCNNINNIRGGDFGCENENDDNEGDDPAVYNARISIIDSQGNNVLNSYDDYYGGLENDFRFRLLSDEARDSCRGENYHGYLSNNKIEFHRVLNGTYKLEAEIGDFGAHSCFRGVIFTYSVIVGVHDEDAEIVINMDQFSPFVFFLPSQERATSTFYGIPGNKKAILYWDTNLKSNYPIAGYNIYKSVIPYDYDNCGVQGTLVNNNLIATTTYAVENLENWTTYFFDVKAVDTQGNESSFSEKFYVTPYPGPYYQFGDKVKLDSNLGYHRGLKIHDDKIVWWNHHGADPDKNGLYTYDIKTKQKTQIPSKLGWMIKDFNIFGNKIVWTDRRNVVNDGDPNRNSLLDNTDIYMYNTETEQETQITSNISMQRYSNIFGDKIVWEDYRNGVSGIYLYDINTKKEQKISNNLKRVSGPKIYGNIITWVDYNNDMTINIYFYDLKSATPTPTKILSNIHRSSRLDVYANKIVWNEAWNDNYDGGSKIYIYDINTASTTQITQTWMGQWYPNIYNNKVISGGTGYRFYDVSTKNEYQLPDVWDSIDVYNDKIVWDALDLDEGHHMSNIYMQTAYTIPNAPEDLTADGTNPSPIKNSTDFKINWTNSFDPSGVKGYWYKLGSEPTSTEDGAYTTEKPFTIFNVTAENQTLYLWLENQDGYKDHTHAASVVLNNVAKPQCSDGIDNDEDGLIDYPNDPGCKNAEDDVEYDDFSFVHMTDVHLGGADYTGNNNWWEELSYPRFTDGLYEIEKLNPKPDFILITGDIVEDVSQIRWLKDFKSIIDGFAERTKTEEHPEGIKVYVVPGNHDRYEKADKFRINERLKNYFTVMGIPQDVNLLFPDLDELESQEQGYNRYNYFFDHKGMQFIGLDSGKDTGKLDRLPESDGLHNDTMKSLNLLGIGNPGIPRVVFMHNPIYHKGLIRKADGSIANNRSEFIEYSQDNNVQLVLSGHVHEAHILENKNGDLVEWEGTSFFPKPPVPLFIQTQSATKDNGEDNQHGYRIIDVKDQVVTLPNATWVDRIVTPRKVTTTTFSPKIIVDLDRYYEPEDWSIIKSDVNLKIYQNPDNNLYLENTGMGFLRNDGSFSLPYFIANNSNRVILYEYPKNTDSKFSITNPNSTKDQYDLFVSKNEGEWEKENFIQKECAWTMSGSGTLEWECQIRKLYYGFKVKNSNYCAINEKCEGGFAIIHTDFTNHGINSLRLKDMSSTGATTDDLLINWEELQITTFEFFNPTTGNLDYRMNGIKGVELTVNGSASTTFDFISNKITIDLHSPGELQAVDSTGNITGLVNGEVKEDIPYSIYDAANETVILFVDEGVDDDLYTYKVVGSDGAPQATYGLTVTKEDKSKDTDNVVTFNATNIQTTDSSTHQYAVNWDKLEKNEKGVEVKVDKEGDGVFEKTIISDNELTEEEFTASAAQQSNSSGGSGVIHNAPLPTTINSINYPMLLAASQEGTLTYNFKQATVKLSAPKEAVKDQTTFNISMSAINANQKLDNTTGAFIIGDKVFNINAKDIKNNVVNNFNKDLTITITLPEMPADVSSLGVYWFNNSDSQWVLVPGATFDSVNNTAIFSVNHLTAFAVINGNGQTTIGLSEEPEIEIIKEVLGKQKYGNGVLLRSQNKRIYVVKNGMLNYISSLEELAKYSGQEILDVSDEDINAYSQEPQDSEKQVLGARKYSDGTLLRGLNMKIYVVSGGKLKYIASLEELSKYAGQDIINVDDEIIVNFGKSEVLGEQQYSNGTLLRGLDKKIYVVADKKLKHIIDLQELAKYAGQDIIDVSDDVIDSF